MSTSTVIAPGISRSKFIPELNGVRGLAILAVLLYHFGSLYSPEHRTVLDNLLHVICHCGWAGVDLFFVLSGFLITGILLDAKGSPRYFRSFYVRRVLRIFPLYYGVLILLFLLVPAMSVTLHFPEHFDTVGHRQQLWFWLHVSNWITAFNPAVPLVTNFWTLSVEEQFYLVWPAVIAICPNRWTIAMCLILIAGAFAIRNIPYFLHIQRLHEDFMYRLTPFRVDPLIFGSLAAILARRSWWPKRAWWLMVFTFIAGLAGLLLVVKFSNTIAPGNLTVARFGYSAVALVGTSLVVYAYLLRGRPRFGARVLRSTVLTRLGEYSYGIYVFHGIVRAYIPHVGNYLGHPSGRL